MTLTKNMKKSLLMIYNYNSSFHPFDGKWIRHFELGKRNMVDVVKGIPVVTDKGKEYIMKNLG